MSSIYGTPLSSLPSKPAMSVPLSIQEGAESLVKLFTIWMLLPDALIDDGKIDFCAVRETGILKIPKLLSIYKEGKHNESPLFDGILAKRQCEKAHIESSEELTVCIDGEIFKSKDIELEILPVSLTFRVPKFD